MVTEQKLAYRSLFIMLAFLKVLKNCNAKGSVKSNDNYCIYDMNMVVFRPVTIELTQHKSIQQVSIGTLVC